MSDKDSKTGNILGAIFFIVIALTIASHLPSGQNQAEVPKSCLSAWDGAVKGSAGRIKSGLREPDSYEHIGTRLISSDDRGRDEYISSFRARNGFGGMNVELATIIVNRRTCDILTLEVAKVPAGR